MKPLKTLHGLIETVGYCMLIVLAVLNHCLHNGLLLLRHGDFKQLKPLDRTMFRVYANEYEFYANPYNFFIDKKSKCWWFNRGVLMVICGFVGLSIYAEIYNKRKHISR